MHVTYDTFIALVQSRARVPTADDAVAVARAVLTTLVERIDREEAQHLVSLLPREIGWLVEKETFASGQRFSFHQFCQRVADREQTDPQLAALHARGVVETLEDALTEEELHALRSRLPDAYAVLFSPETEDRSRLEPDAHRISAANPLPRAP